MVIGQMPMDICGIISVAMITTTVAFTRSTDILGSTMEKSISTHSYSSVLCSEKSISVSSVLHGVKSISSLKFLDVFCSFWQSKISIPSVVHDTYAFRSSSKMTSDCA